MKDETEDAAISLDTSDATWMSADARSSAVARSGVLTLTEESSTALFENATDAILVCDGDGVILRANAEVQRIFGHPRHELIGQTVELLIPTRLRKQHEVHRRHYIARPTFRLMGTFPHLVGLWAAERQQLLRS